ncbi:hypothetical protein D3C73_1338270 [compost metagenome]
MADDAISRDQSARPLAALVDPEQWRLEQVPGLLHRVPEQPAQRGELELVAFPAFRVVAKQMRGIDRQARERLAHPVRGHEHAGAVVGSFLDELPLPVIEHGEARREGVLLLPTPFLFEQRKQLDLFIPA